MLHTFSSEIFQISGNKCVKWDMKNELTISYA